MSTSNSNILKVLSLLSFILLGVVSLLRIDSMWGMNHLQFLPGMFSVIYCVIGIFLIAILFINSREKSIGKYFEAVDRWLWQGRRLNRYILAGVFMALFWIFRVEVHLLGDGYTWLANFGGDGYIHKFTEPGSIYLIRLIQSVLGGFTERTALMAFQIISICSGAVFINNILSIVGKMTSKTHVRIIGLATFLFSGSILLFFGYVEFYPMLWALLSISFNYSVNYILNKKGRTTAVMFYIAAVLTHLQAFYFLPGYFYLLTYRIKNNSIRKGLYLAGLAIILAFGIGAVWLYSTGINYEVLVLPLLEGRPISPDYAILSVPHLANLVNLLVLVFPGALIVLGLAALNFRIFRFDIKSRFWGLMSIGPLLFLTVFGAGVTMGRDWDIMALSLLAPFFLLLGQFDNISAKISNRLVLSYAIIVGFYSIAFLSVSIGINSAENRFYSLLDNRHENSWAIYANYFSGKGDINRFREIIDEKNRRFPDTELLANTYQLLESGENERAMAQAKTLVQRNKYNPSFLQVMGNVYSKLNVYDSSDYFYSQAMALEPYNVSIINEYGQLYLKRSLYNEAIELFERARILAPHKTEIVEGLGLAYIYKEEYESAKLYADTLFMSNTNSPGGCLIMMSLLLRNEEYNLAANYYRQYLEFGAKRSDYNRIKSYYKNLENY